jgi:hypothetical protein
MRSIVVVGSAMGVVPSGWLAAVVVQHAGQPVYDLPGYAVAIGLVGAVAALAGWVLVAWRGDGVGLGAVLTAVLALAGVLALMSIGILLLAAAGVLTMLLIRAAARRPVPVSVRSALGAAVLVGLGLPALALVAADGPVVECLDNGVSGSSSFFRQSSTSSGATSTSSISAGGRAAAPSPTAAASTATAARATASPSSR